MNFARLDVHIDHPLNVFFMPFFYQKLIVDKLMIVYINDIFLHCMDYKLNVHLHFTYT
jgi:hypothetical protein